MMNYVKIVKQIDQHSELKKFLEFLLIFTFKVKINFGSLFKRLKDLIQSSVLNIALRSLFKDLESRKVCDKQMSFMQIPFQLLILF